MNKNLTRILILLIAALTFTPCAEAASPKKRTPKKRTTKTTAVATPTYTKELWIDDTPTAYNWFASNDRWVDDDWNVIGEAARRGYQICDWDGNPIDKELACMSHCYFKPGVFKMIHAAGSGGSEYQFKFIGRPDLAQKFISEAKQIIKEKEGSDFKSYHFKVVGDVAMISTFRFTPAEWKAYKPDI